MPPKHDYRSEAATLYRKLYKTARWAAIRNHQLSTKPFCEWCEREGRTSPATVVHHSTPHRGDKTKFFDPNNLTSLCAPCHDIDAQGIEARGYSKSIGEDGWPLDPQHPANQGEGGIKSLGR